MEQKTYLGIGNLILKCGTGFRTSSCNRGLEKVSNSWNREPDLGSGNQFLKLDLSTDKLTVFPVFSGFPLRISRIHSSDPPDPSTGSPPIPRSPGTLDPSNPAYSTFLLHSPSFFSFSAFLLSLFLSFFSSSVLSLAPPPPGIR